MPIGNSQVSLDDIRAEYDNNIIFNLSLIAFNGTIINGRYHYVCTMFYPLDGTTWWKIMPLGWIGDALSEVFMYSLSNFRVYKIENIQTVTGAYGPTSVNVTISADTSVAAPTAGQYLVGSTSNKYNLQRYYAGFILPTGIGNIPSSGPIGIGNFRNTARFTTSYKGYIPDYRETTGFLQTNNWNILPDTLEATAGAVPVDNNWHTRLSNVSLTFSTLSVSSGYYIDFTETTGWFACSYSWFSDWFSTWYRYFRVRNYGYAIRNVTSGGGWTFFRGTGEVIRTTYQSLKTGSGRYGLTPNTTYRLRYVLDFRGDNSNGFSAARYVGDKRYFGYVGSYFDAYTTNY